MYCQKYKIDFGYRIVFHSRCTSKPNYITHHCKLPRQVYATLPTEKEKLPAISQSSSSMFALYSGTSCTRSKWEHSFFANTDAWNMSIAQIIIYIYFNSQFRSRSPALCTSQLTHRLCDYVFLCYRHQSRQCVGNAASYAVGMPLTGCVCMCVCVCRWNFSSLFICFHLHFDLTACHFILFLYFSIRKAPSTVRLTD